jgi:hypothetical protein
MWRFGKRLRENTQNFEFCAIWPKPTNMRV